MTSSPRAQASLPRALSQALALKRSRDLEGAVVALEGVLDLAASHPVALAHLADVQLQRGRLDEAAMALERAEATGGTTPFVARLRGDWHAKCGRFREAATCYQDSVSLGDRGTWTLLRLARCRVHVGDLVGARGAAGEALARDPTSTAAWVVLGDIESREGRLEEAEASFARAHEHSPGDQWAYAKLVEARMRRLPQERRRHELEVLLQTTGRENRHLVGVLAKLQREEGDHDQAARTWAGQADRSGDPFARKMEGFALSKAGKLDEAAAILGPCLEDRPDDPVLFRAYVSLQRRRNALEELRATLEAALPRASAARRGPYLGQLRKLTPVSEASS